MSVDKFGRSGKSNSVITKGVSLSNNFLRRDGTNTATGSINMTGNTLTNVSNPVNAQDIATKNYVEQNTILRNGTQTMVGNLDMGNYSINNLQNPADDQDAVTKAYSDAVAKAYANTRLFRGGGTMTGDIKMTDNRITGLSDPVDNHDAATKLYVDTNMARQREPTQVAALRARSPTTAIFTSMHPQQPLLGIGAALANIPLNVEGMAMSGIILADPINIHITTGGLFRFEICGNCVAPRPPVPGICPEGLIQVGTPTHTICWTPIGGDRDTSFSRFAYYRIASNETVSLKCQKTGAALRPLNVSVWLTIERINNN